MKVLAGLLVGLIFSFHVAHANDTKIKARVSSEQKKIDILFVIDNSPGMATVQDDFLKLVDKVFSRLQAQSVDYHIAVTATDAWRLVYMEDQIGGEILRSLRVGPVNYTVYPYAWLAKSGVRIIDSMTPDPVSVFKINARQGSSGSPDERAFSSFRDVLFDPANADFRRADAFLSILVLSNEDDLSTNTAKYIQKDYANETDADPVTLRPGDALYELYADPRLLTISSFQQYLEYIAGPKNFSFSAFGILDVPCKVQLNSLIRGGRIGRRYMELANQTNGITGSLCNLEKAVSDYAEHLAQITKRNSQR